MEILAGSFQLHHFTASIQCNGVAAISYSFAGTYPGGHHGAVDLVAGLHVCRDGGLGRVQRMIVIQQRGGGDDSFGIVVLSGEAQLFEGAEHTIGYHAPELALFNLHTAGKQGLVLGHGDQIAFVNVPGTGDNLGGLPFADINLADPHVVGVRVALHGDNPSGHHIFQRVVEHLGDFHLGAGKGHGLGKVPIADGAKIHKFIEPFSG